MAIVAVSIEEVPTAAGDTVVGYTLTRPTVFWPPPDGPLGPRPERITPYTAPDGGMTFRRDVAICGSGQVVRAGERHGVSLWCWLGDTGRIYYQIDNIEGWFPVQTVEEPEQGGKAK